MQITIPQNAQTVISTLAAKGFEANVVGGCVRDALLGTAPHDWDVCTNAEPAQVEDCFRAFKTFDAGIKHGTVTVVVDGELIEVTTYRIDGVYADNRHPDRVSFTKSLAEDLARRDFTINAMAYCDKDGITDPFGGREDLKRGVIRCVGDPDLRFGEDALRILRALRFASRLGFSIHYATAESIHKNAALLNSISAERIRDELMGILCGSGAEQILNEYRDVIAVIIPELAECFDFDQCNKHHVYDVYRHITRSVGVSRNHPLIRLTMLLHDIGKPQSCTQDSDGTKHFKGHQKISADISRTVLRRLRFSNITIDNCLRLVLFHDVRFNGSKRLVKRVLNHIGEDNMRLLFEVQLADLLAQSDYKREYKLNGVLNAQLQLEEILRQNDCFSLKQLALNGRDLINAGITDGRQIGKILYFLLDEVIDEKLANEKNALLARALEVKDSFV